MLDRCGTEGQQTDEDPRYNSTVGISAGLNVGAHLDFGVLSVMVRYEPSPRAPSPRVLVADTCLGGSYERVGCWQCTEPFVNASTPNILQCVPFLLPCTLTSPS